MPLFTHVGAVVLIRHIAEPCEVVNIKKSAGYRLVYEVEEQKITVLVIAVGKRDNFQVYVKAKTRK